MKCGGTAGATQSGTITREDLQQEFEHFASESLQRELQELSARMEQMLDDKLQQWHEKVSSLMVLPRASKQTARVSFEEHFDDGRRRSDGAASIASVSFADQCDDDHGSSVGPRGWTSERRSEGAESSAGVSFADDRDSSVGHRGWTSESSFFQSDPLAADNSPRQRLRVRKFPRGGATCTSKAVEHIEATTPWSPCSQPEESEEAVPLIRATRVSMWSQESKQFRRSFWQGEQGEVDEAPGGLRRARLVHLSQEDMEWIQSITLEDEVIDRPTCLQTIVAGDHFNSLVFWITVLNLVFIAFQTDYMARNWASVSPFWFKIVEAFFCIAFLLELILRMAASGCKYFQNAGNMFDILMVAIQVLETYLAFWSSNSHITTTQFRVLRLVRLFRMIRVTRVLRLINQVKELRLLLSATGETIRPLGYMLLPLAMMSVVFAMVLTQLATEYKLSGVVDALVTPQLEAYYGSVDRATLALFQVISGGIEWRKLMVPLIQFASPWIQIFFVCYVAITVLGMMQVIMGIFVDSVSRAAEYSKKRTLVEQMKSLFDSIDTDGSGTVEWDEFEAQVNNPQMLAYLKEIDFDREQALELFKLLDVEGTGSIDPDAWLSGCLILAGPAKALDLAILLNEFRDFVKNWTDHANIVQESLQELEQQMQNGLADGNS